MRLTTVLFSTALLAIASAATAQSGPTVPPKVVKGDPNKLICKTTATTGSRLKPNRDCRTAQQWADSQAFDRRDLDRMQTNRYRGGE